MRGRSRPNWSSLPEDVLAIIAKRLFIHSLDDILRFRAVCRSFRSSSSTFYPPKTLIPRSSFRIYFSIDSTPGNGSNFILSKSTIYAIHPLHEISDTQETTSTWLVRIEELNSGKVRINDLLGGHCFKNLSNELPQSLNLLDYRIKKITTAYRLKLSTLGDNTVPEFSSKVIVSECVDGFAVMAIRLRTGKLVICRNGDEKWINLDITVDSFTDIVYHNEKFYALGHTGLTIAVDYPSLSITQVTRPQQNIHFPKYLVKSSEDLFMVSKSSLCLKVYKLDEEKCEWVPVMHELENRVLFVGYHCSFSLSANEFPGCGRNGVYITDDFGVPHKNFPGMRTGFYNLEDGYLHVPTGFYGLERPYGPLISKIFWPPPTWIKQHSRSTPSHSRRRHPGR